MEVNLLSKLNIDPDSILSIRAGTVRRQAQISSGRPFRFPKISMDENPLKIDILKQVGTAYLVMKPGEEQYKVLFAGEMGDMSCEVEVKKSEGGEAVAAKEAADDKKVEASASAKDAKDYLEGHQVLQFVQAVLQTVIKEKPANPYEYMARHFMSGYAKDDQRASVSAAAPANRAPPEPPAADTKPAPTPAEDAPAEAAKAAPPAEEAKP
ncbi:unnamed protein product, partial [Polarella glacialis]